MTRARFILCLLAASSATVLAGCGAGVTGAAVGLSSSSDSSDGPPHDALPVITDIDPVQGSSPDRIEFSFTIVNDDGDAGRLGVTLEYVVEGDDRRHALTLAPPVDLSDIAAGQTLMLVWDAGTDLGENAEMAKIIITPSEDDVRGESFSSSFFRAGNTPVDIRNVRPSASGDVLFVNFDLVDEMSDPADLVAVEMGVAEPGETPEAFFALPDSILDPVRRFFTAPGPLGNQASFSLHISQLEADDVPEELRVIARPGFVGEIAVRVRVRDFPGEPESTGMGTMTLNNNTLPLATLLPFPSWSHASDIIPIRFQVFDPDLNQVDVGIEVTAPDGQGFVPVNAFPAGTSAGTRDLPTLPVDQHGNPAAPYHIFLGDLSPPWVGERTATVRVIPRDRQEGLSGTGTLLLPGRILAGPETIEAPQPWEGIQAAGDFNGDGYHDLAIGNLAGNSLSVFLGGPAGLNRLEPDLPTGESPAWAIATDMDRDGFCDVLIANRGHADPAPDGVPDSVSTFRGGPAGLVPTGEVGVGEYPNELVAADFDRDGFLDLAVTNRLSSDISYIQGGPDGCAWIDDIPVGDYPWRLATGDFDGDDFADLVIASRGAQEVTSVRGGTEGLMTGDARSTGVGGIPLSTSCGDFDLDGHADAIVPVAGRNVALVFPGTENGLGEEPVALPLGNLGDGQASIMPAIGDFDGDGFPDILVPCPGEASLSYLRGGRTGLTVHGTISVVNFPNDVVAGDFDDDGVLDALVSSRRAERVSVVRGGPLGVESCGELPVQTGMHRLTTGDVDGDGATDVCGGSATRQQVLLFRGMPGGLSPAADILTTGRPSLLARGDFNADGLPDLVSASQSADTAMLHRGTGAMLSPGEPLTLGSSLRDLLAYDFDRDGHCDLLATDYLTSTVLFWRGSAASAMAPESIPVVAPPTRLAGGDFDGDGDMDAAVAHAGTRLTFLCWDTAGFRPESTDIGMRADVLVPGDLDRDGTDAVLATSEDGNLLVLAGSQRQPSSVTVGDGPRAIVAGDFDGDGDLDAVTANRVSRDVTYLEGQGDDLVPAGNVPVGGTPLGLASGDFNGDGFLDVLVTSDAPGAASFLPGGVACLPDWQAGIHTIHLGEAPGPMVTADFDGDGFLDVLVAHASSSGLTYLAGSRAGLYVRQRRLVTAPQSTEAAAMIGGDVDGDGLADMVVAHRDRHNLTVLRQIYRQGHATVRVPPEGGAPVELRDPRSPSSYRLVLEPSGPGHATQICVIPSCIPELPQRAAHLRGTYLLAATDTITIKSEAGALDGAATLTLRLRDEVVSQEELQDGSCFRVLRVDPESGRAGEAALDGDPPEIVDFGASTAISFPVTLPGSYVVACERDRSGVDPLPTFVRGDFDGNGRLDLADIVVLLRHIHVATTSVACVEAGDVDDDGALELADAMALALFIYRSGNPPAPPFPTPGPDTDDDGLPCYGRTPDGDPSVPPG